ncbi:predicted protein [Enterococcus gallinarum EG2]|nr:predicted protein [Enterococcus gallinarum EG2]
MNFFRSTCQCVPLTKRPLGVIDHCSDIFFALFEKRRYSQGKLENEPLKNFLTIH